MDEISHKNWLEPHDLPAPSRWAVAFGAILPILVLMLEPFILHPDNGIPFGPVSVLFGPTALYVSALTTVLIFLTWHRPASSAEARALRAGWLIFGVITSSLVGCVVFLPATLGIAFLFIGALGYSPFLVTYIHFRKLRDYPSKRALPRKWLALGIGLHAVLSLGLYVAERQFFERLVAGLQAPATIDTRLSTLRLISFYPFAFSRLDNLICSQTPTFDQDYPDRDKFETEFNAGLSARFGARTGDVLFAMGAALGKPNVADACMRIVVRSLN